MEKDSIKLQIANQSALKLKAMTRDEFAKLGGWYDINKAYSAYEEVMEALLLAVEHEMEGDHNEQ